MPMKPFQVLIGNLHAYSYAICMLVHVYYICMPSAEALGIGIH